MSAGGLSKARLGRMHDVMARHVEHGGVPGLVTLVSRRGETHVDALGPMRRDTIFRIASMTKPVAAVAAMILVEECKLRLDEPVDRLLPELADRKVLRRLDGPLEDTVPARRPISLRDLLTLRLGFGYVFDAAAPSPIVRAANAQGLLLGPARPQELPAPDEWLRRFATLPLMHQPGETWMYDVGLDVLGVLIARAAGQGLEAFMRERIFGPLRMKDTGFSVPGDKIDRLAPSYWTNFETGAFELYDDAKTGQWSRPPAFPAAASGLVSTVDDYLAFGHMMLNRGTYGSERILSRPSVETMTADQLTPPQKAASGLMGGYFDSHGWGFGLAMVTRRDDVSGAVGTFGWDGGLGTAWRTDPREEMVTILMTQRAWTSPTPPAVCQDFLTSAYQAIDD